MQPILTELNINIGGMFLYKDQVWIRTDRYSARSVVMGSCHFGYLGERDGENDKEWKNVLLTAEKLDMEKVQTTLLNVIEDCLDKGETDV